METLKVEGLTARYLVTGEGAPVVLAHCSSASHKAWFPLMETTKDRFQCFAPDLIGYGKSDSWPEGKAFDPFIDVKLLETLVNGISSPVHLVGHSYGGAMALEAARRLGDRVRGLTLIEPVAFHLLRNTQRESEWRYISRIAHGAQRAVMAGDHKKAVDIYMGFWVGRLKWFFAPAKMRKGVTASITKVALEFGSLEQVDLTLADYQGLTVPTRLLLGSRTRAPARAVVEALAETLPKAEQRTILGAGHMSPLTHPRMTNELIVEHLERCLTGAGV